MQSKPHSLYVFHNPAEDVFARYQPIDSLAPGIGVSAFPSERILRAAKVHEVSSQNEVLI